MDKANGFWVNLQSTLDKLALRLVPRRATVGTSSASGTTVQFDDDSAPSDEPFARIYGFVVNPGDEVYVLSTDGGYVLLGGLQRAASTGYALDALLTVPGVVINGGVRMGGAGTPTITPGSSAGTGASIANVTGGEYNGYFELTAGTAPATGQVAHVQFANALGNNHYAVILQDESGTLTLKSPYVRDKTTTDFYVGMNVAPTTAAVYKVSYVILGRPS